MVSTYGKSVFVKKLIFSQNQNAPYVFEQKNQKKRVFCEKLTLSANAYRENENHDTWKGENALKTWSKLISTKPERSRL